MNAKEYLNQIHKLQWQIGALQEQVLYLRNKAQGVKAIVYDMDKIISSPANDMERIIMELAEASNKLQDRILEYIDITIKAERQITDLENKDYARVLTLRYILTDDNGEQFTLEKIAEMMNYSSEWIRHLHTDALNAFEKKYLQD